MELEFEYGFNLDEQQRKDNENYLNKVDKKVDKDVGKQVDKKIGIMKPIPVDELMLTWQPTEWIIDSFGAKGACVLLAGDKGSGKTAFLYRLSEAISNGSVFMGELSTTSKKVLVWQADESRNNAHLKLR